MTPGKKKQKKSSAELERAAISPERSQVMGLIVALRCLRFGLIFSGLSLAVLFLLPSSTPQSVTTLLPLLFLFGVYLMLIGTLLTLGRCRSPRARGVLLITTLGGAIAWSLLQGSERVWGLVTLGLFWTQGLLFEAKLNPEPERIIRMFSILQITGAGTLMACLLIEGALANIFWLGAAAVYLLLLFAITEWLKELRQQNTLLDTDDA